MIKEPVKTIRRLAVWPLTRGFSHALIEGPTSLTEWGHKSARGNINIHCLAILKKLIGQLAPDVLVLESPTDPKGRRGPRIKKLLEDFIKLAATKKLKVHIILREEVRKTLLGSPDGTKHDVAKRIADMFPEELGADLPPKRREWDNEDYHMGTFAAVGMALTSFHLQERHRVKKG